ncbi:MAG: peptidoglycan-associated lipoprotein Pal [Nitrospirae bacterium]|nr:peptidoglycan-associated lipoprotein Pal [Candidatus Manganitrophaceae bacterium]
MGRSFSYFAGLFILFAAFVLTGCPKKVSSTEGTAGVGREKPAEPPASTAPIEPPMARPAPPVEEKMPPMAGGDKSGMEGGAPGGESVSALQDIFFDFDQASIRPESRKILEADAQWLTSHPQEKIQIEGHCDERGTEEYNLTLGERRAKSVLNFLVNMGVSPSRLSFISYGEEKPFCSDRSEDCYQKNRRAHFVGGPK